MNRKSVQKLVILVIIAAAAAVIYQSGLHEKLSLAYLKDSQADFAALYQQHPIAVISAFFLIYVVATALSLPGAAVLTLAGGGLFGFWVGTIVVSFASTIGATLACMASRFILQEWVQSKFGSKIESINQGIESEGAFYLFTLRLIPLFPFFMVNLVLGLTKMRFITYFWVSQLGMLAGTMVYVNAGKELAKINSLGDILSVNLIASFVILGLFPLTVKKIMGFVKSKKSVN